MKDKRLDELENPEATELDVNDGGPADLTNTDRARRAQDALIRYADVTDNHGEPVTGLVTDFLADLQHMCRMNGLDFDDMVRISRDHHEAEREGDW